MLEKVKEILEKFGIQCKITSDGYTGSKRKTKYALHIIGNSQKEILEFIKKNSLHEERKLRAKYALDILKSYDDGKLDEIEQLYEDMLN